MKTPLIIENARNTGIYTHFITFFGISSLLLIACTLIFQKHRNEVTLNFNFCCSCRNTQLKEIKSE